MKKIIALVAIGALSILVGHSKGGPKAGQEVTAPSYLGNTSFNRDQAGPKARGKEERAEKKVVEFTVFCGAMLRPAIEETVERFEKREVSHVNLVYNGDGILIAQMKAGQIPDIYLASDKSFMDQVGKLFKNRVEVSKNPLVILVPKGNPKMIRKLVDLGSPGLRVGLGHPRNSVVGVLTEQLLTQAGGHDKVRKNVVVESPTSVMLVNQLRVGSLDAVVVFASNAVSLGKEAELIPIEIPHAAAIQVIAISKQCRHPFYGDSLLKTLTSEESRKKFESVGFTWLATKKKASPEEKLPQKADK